MPGALEEEKRNTIVRLLFHRCRPSEIAHELEVSLALVKKIERNLLDHGTPTKPNLPIRGRPKILKPETLEEMLQVWEMTGLDIGQKQLCQWLEGRHGVKINQSTISRIIKKSGRKKAVAVVAEAKKIQEEAAQGQPEHAFQAVERDAAQVFSEREGHEGHDGNSSEASLQTPLSSPPISYVPSQSQQMSQISQTPLDPKLPAT